MTDGIIQQVFNRYWSHEIKCKECKYAQEEVLPRLTEKIKQEFEFDWRFERDYLPKLIGDNKE